MFEQSILAGHGASRPWSFLASLSAELTIVSLAIVIPLVYSDHLPDFHWKSVMVGPPPRPIEPQPVTTNQSTATASPVVTHRVFIRVPSRPLPDTAVAERGQVTLDSPPGLIGVSDSIGTGPRWVADLIRTPAVAAIRPPDTGSKPSSGPLRVSTGPQMAKLVKQVIPVYPPLAKSIRISGVVHLVGIIGKDGAIKNLQVISGHPMLTQAALEAVRQWVYKPTLLNGEPVEVITPIDVNFILSQQ